MLQVLKRETGEPTDTAMIRYIIRNYEKLNNKYNVELPKNREFADKIFILQERITEFLSAFKNLEKE